MPILQVRALPQGDKSRVQPALKATCLAIADAYGCEAKHVWATWQEIDPGFYIEGEAAADTQPSGTHPPIVELLCFEGKDDATIEKTLITAAKTLSDKLEIPDNIFVNYTEAKSGRVVAGNGIVRR